MGYVPAPCTDDEKQPMLETQHASPDAGQTKWSTGLFDCFAAPGGGALGCVSLGMPCVQYGTLMEQLPDSRLYASGSFCQAAGTFFCLDFLAAGLGAAVLPHVYLLPLSGLLHMKTRRHLREKYNIEGSTWGDLCTSWWCGPCALAQETREVIIRSDAERQAAYTSGATLSMPPAPVHMGNLLLPAHTASAPAAALPATGVPVMHVPALPAAYPKADAPVKAAAN